MERERTRGDARTSYTGLRVNQLYYNKDSLANLQIVSRVDISPLSSTYRLILHPQVQGNAEHFRDICGGAIGWLDSVTYYTAFTEGWALYAENPLIAQDTDAYKTEPMQRFGMLKWQVEID